MGNRIPLTFICCLTATSLFAQTVQPKTLSTEKKSPVTAPSEGTIQPSQPSAVPVVESELLVRLKAVFQYGNSQQVRDALSTMQRLKPEEQKTLVPHLRVLCKSSDPLVQRKMMETIGILTISDLDEEAINILKNADDDQIFFASVSTLTKKKIPSALPAVHEMVKNYDFTKQGNRLSDLVNILVSYQDKSLADLFITKLGDTQTHFENRGHILRYLGEAGVNNPDVILKIQTIFDDEAESLTVRGYAAHALSKLSAPGAKEKLRDALKKIDAIKSNDEKKRYSRFRMSLISALVRLQDDNVREILIQMTKDDDELTRLRAIQQIGALKMSEMKELLEYKSKYDPSLRVQREAKKILESVGKDATTPVKAP